VLALVPAKDEAERVGATVQALQGSLQQLPAGQYGIKDGASGLLPERTEGS